MPRPAGVASSPPGSSIRPRLDRATSSKRRGWAISRVPVTDTGTLALDTIVAALDADVALLTVMLAQNETGAIMPVAGAARAARHMGIVTHTDAAQAIGKIEVNVESLGVDLLSIAGHKCYAPKGVGALYVRGGTSLDPVLVGAGQEGGLRPGTENVAHIVGMGAACRLAQGRMESEATRLRRLRDQLWLELSSRIPGLERHPPRIRQPAQHTDGVVPGRSRPRRPQQSHSPCGLHRLRVPCRAGHASETRCWPWACRPTWPSAQ